MGTWYELRRCVALRSVVALVAAGTALLVYFLTTFSTSIESALAQGVRVDGDRRVISITDDAEGDGQYERYFAGPHGPLQPLRFYRRLTRARNFDYVSVMDQPVFVEPFPGIDPFVQGGDGDYARQPPFADDVLGGRPAVALSTMLMNEAAWKAFALAAEPGTGLDWSGVDYERDEIPVAVGADMARIKPVGSTIPADYYGRRVTLKVAAVLRRRSVIYTSADENTSLDRSIVVPYPRQISDAAAGGPHRKFYEGVVGNLTHGDLYYDAATPLATVEGEVALASRVSDFPAYVYLNSSDVLVKYRLMRTILEQQRGLVVGIGALVAVAALLLMGAGRFRLARLRAPWVRLVWERGTSRPMIVRTVVVGHVAYGVLALTCFIGGVATTDAKGEGAPFVAAFTTLAALFAIDAAHAAWLTWRAIDAGPIEGDAHA